MLSADDLVAVPETTRYHVPSCALVGGKAVRSMVRAGHEASGLEPCGICRP
jgi:cytidine deaminase